MNEIPIDFLANCSTRSIEELMLAKENTVANLRKQLRLILDEIIDESREADFARYMLKHRDDIRHALESIPAVLDGRSTGKAVSEALCLLGDSNVRTETIPK